MSLYSHTDETSLTSFDDAINQNKMATNTESSQISLSASSDLEFSSNDNEDWKSAYSDNDINIDDIQKDSITVHNKDHQHDGWANFDTFDNNQHSNIQVNNSS